MIFLGNLARKIIRSVKYVGIRLVLLLTKCLLLLNKDLISISYDSGDRFDGTGAQLQRMASIYALARYLNIKFVQTPITGITIHPSDPFQEYSSYKEYLSRVDNFFELDASSSHNNYSSPFTYKYTHLSAFTLLCLTTVTIFGRKAIYLGVFEVNSIIDAYPFLIRKYVKVNASEILKTYKKKNDLDALEVAVHYRQGVGNFPIYPGQTLSRQTALKDYTTRLSTIIDQHSNNRLININIYTDSPRETTEYFPPKDQLNKWVGTPGFDGAALHLYPTDFKELTNLASERIKVSIHYGGYPLDLLVLMMHADILMISRSSLSYLAGLLNLNGEIYVPKYFWHSSLKSWKRL